MSERRSKKSARGKEVDRPPPTYDDLDADRRGKAPFTNAEVLERWRRIRDSSLVLCEKLLSMGGEIPKYLSSLTDTITRAQAEITGLERLLGESSSGISLGWLPYEPDKEDGPPDTEVEA